MALHTQQQIGWRRMLAGHLSLHWEPSCLDSSNGNDGNHLWSAATVETLLLQMHKLWEQRNADVHGKSEAEQKHLQLQSQKQITSNLTEQKMKCLSHDRHVFPDNPSNLMNNQSPKELETWIVTRRRPVILKSMKLAKEKDTSNAQTITHWFQPVNNVSISGIRLWNQDNLRCDPENNNKKNWKAKAGTKHCHQKDLHHCLCLQKVY